MEGLNIIKKRESTFINPLNASICFLTESEYLQCSYCQFSNIIYFTVGIYDLNLDYINKKTIKEINKDIFNYLFHIKMK